MRPITIDFKSLEDNIGGLTKINLCEIMFSISLTMTFYTLLFVAQLEKTCSRLEHYNP